MNIRGRLYRAADVMPEEIRPTIKFLPPARRRQSNFASAARYSSSARRQSTTLHQADV
jgi:hypothetical protein